MQNTLLLANLRQFEESLANVDSDDTSEDDDTELEDEEEEDSSSLYIRCWKFILLAWVY